MDDDILKSQEEQDGDGYINMTSPEHQIRIPSHSGMLKLYLLIILLMQIYLLPCQAKYY